MVSLFAVRKACAALAVQLCPLDGVVSIINSSLQDADSLHLRAVMFDLDLNVLREESTTVSCPANSALETFAFALPPTFAEVPVYFVKLELRHADGTVAADNFYWLSPRQDDYEQVYTGDMLKMPANKPLFLPRQTPCFPELSELRKVSLGARARHLPERHGDARVRVSVSNPEVALAFFIRVRVVDAGSGEEVLPVYWTDNYFSLLPGESREITASLPRVPAGEIEVAVDGWNIDPGRFVIKAQ
jgi:exo-1,4-beta-D-glucosaminidase